MADRLKRRPAARSIGPRQARLPRRSSVDVWLGGGDAAAAEYAYRRLQEEFAKPLPTSTFNARFGPSNDPQPPYQDVGGFLGDELRKRYHSLALQGVHDATQIAPLAESFEPLDQVGEVKGNAKMGRLRRPVVAPKGGEPAAANTALEWSLPQISESFQPLDEVGEVEGNAKTGRLRRPVITPQGDEPMPKNPELNWSLRQLYVNAVANGLMWAGLKPWTAHKQADGLVSLAEFSPLGILTAADEAKRAFNRGDYSAGAVASLGAIPILGKARGSIKEAAEGLETVAKKWEPTIFKEVDRLPEVPQVDLPRHVPARGLSPKVLDLIHNRAVRDKVLEFAERGITMGGLEWHQNNPLRYLYWKDFKPEAADRGLRLFANLVGATAPLSDVPTNIRLASYYNHLIKTGRQAEMALKNPYPWGHKLEHVHKRNVQRVLDGSGSLDPKHNPKGASMGANLSGNLLPIQVDSKIYRLLAMPSADPRWLRASYRVGKDGLIIRPRQMFERGEISFADALSNPSWWLSQPQRNEYGAFEQYVQGLSRELGLPPASFEGALWVGGGPLAGLRSDPWKPFLGHLEDRAHLNASIRDISPEQVIRDSIIHGKFPLLSLAGVGLGAAGGGVLMRANEHNDRTKRRSPENAL